MELTRRPSDKDVISAAMARFCGTIVYEAMRQDRAADVAKGKTTKRKTKQVLCAWVLLNRYRAGGCCRTLTCSVGPPGPMPTAAPPVQD